MKQCQLCKKHKEHMTYIEQDKYWICRECMPRYLRIMGG